jgi:pyruvate dehydrogenase E2 component (dihydrolipoamide acetyltransferase)
LEKYMAEMKQVLVPDIGDYKNVSVIEVMVQVGDTIKVDDTLLTLETDKAAMDVPSPYAGVVKELNVEIGNKVSKDTLILLLLCDDQPALPVAAVAAPVAAPVPVTAPVPVPVSAPVAVPVAGGSINALSHASPGVRRFARELGVVISEVTGSGEKGRVTKEDVQNFIKIALQQPRQPATSGNAMPAPEMPVIDFAQFGAIEISPLSRIQKLSGANLHRNWLAIPHVTQFDEADITELEAFRKQLGAEYAKQDIKITPLAFTLKAVVAALQKFPKFNSSLDGDNLVMKGYFHIGVAVDTPDGLMVPVLRDVDKKGIIQLAIELAQISAKARDKKITASDMQGGCFTISSLGGIGGTAFTPIINAPEVAILGVSRSSMKPVYQDGVFVPRLMLPLSVSYDHRVIDGALAARFTSYLAQVLSDIRRLTL